MATTSKHYFMRETDTGETVVEEVTAEELAALMIVPTPPEPE